MLGIFVYYPIHSAGFLLFDDDWSIYNNPYVKSVNFLNSFRFVYYFDYTPLSTFYFSVVNRFFGLDPFYYHLFNVLLHFINGFLTYLLGRKIFNFTPLTAYLFAAIFIIHPMHVESVAWATEAKDILSVFFLLVSWLIFFHFNSTEQTRYFFYFVSLSLFFLSLASKTITVTFPLLLFAFYFIHNSYKLSKKNIIQLLPFFGFSILFSLLRIYAESGKMRLLDQSLTPVHLVKNTIIKYVFYFSRSIFPHHLSGFYENGVFELFWYEYFIFLVFLVVTLLVFKTSHNLIEKRNILYSLIFTAVALLPMLKIIPWSVNFLVADRYIYFPSIGLYALIAILLNKLFSLRKIRLIAIAYIILIMSHFTVLARNRVYVWHNDFNLWSDVLNKYPNTKKGLHNLSVQHLIRKENEKALILQKKLLELEPANIKNKINMISPQIELGKIDTAIQEIEKLEKETPLNMTVAHTLAILYYNQQEYSKAASKLKLVLLSDPTHLFTHKLLNRINEKLMDRNIYLYQKKLVKEFKIPILLIPQ
jgi:protein O-mannosyl-transferase